MDLQAITLYYNTNENVLESKVNNNVNRNILNELLADNGQTALYGTQESDI